MPILTSNAFLTLPKPLKLHVLIHAPRQQEQIIGVLKEHQAGAAAADLCRKHGISDATFYKWRSKYGGMEVSDAKRLRGLEEENAKLKKLLAESMLDVLTLREMLAKNW